MNNFGAYVLFIGLSVFLGTRGFGLQLELFDEIGANEPSITLNKLGLLKSEAGDPPLQNIALLPLLDLPKIPLFLSSQDLVRMIRSRYGLSVRVIGKGIRIYPLYTLILDQEIGEKIKTELRHIYPTLPYEFVHVMLMHSPKFPKVPAGNLSYKIRIPGGRVDVTKYVRVEVSEDSKELINTSFPIRIIFYLPKWRSKHFIASGTILHEKDFTFQTTPTLKMPQNFLQKTTSPFGRKLRKNMKLGEFFSWNKIVK